MSEKCNNCGKNEPIYHLGIMYKDGGMGVDLCMSCFGDYLKGEEIVASHRIMKDLDLTNVEITIKKVVKPKVLICVMVERKRVIDKVIEMELNKMPFVNDEHKELIRQAWYKEFEVI